MRKNFKRLLAVTLTGAMTLSLAACGSKDDDKKKDDKKDEAFTLTLDQIKLGEDYTSVKADLKFLTHKTDITHSRITSRNSRNCIQMSTLSTKESPIMQMILQHVCQPVTGVKSVWFLLQLTRMNWRITLLALAIRASLAKAMMKGS